MFEYLPNLLLEREFKLLDRKGISSYDDKELVLSFGRFTDIYMNWFAVTMSVELVTVTIEPKFGKLLKSYYKPEQHREYSVAFATLSSPRELTFYRKEQLALIKLIQMNKKGQETALKLHQKRYNWILNSYQRAKILDAAYFRKELSMLKKSNYKSILSDITTYKSKLKQNKKTIISKIGLSKEGLELMNLVERFGNLQDDRKMYNFKADYYLELFLDEFSKRSGNDKEDLRFLLPNELSSVLKTTYNSLAKARRLCFVFVCSEGEIKQFTGDKALNIAKRFASNKNLNEGMIHGMVASVGLDWYFRGTAKVVHSVNEIDKINDGDILVATMTSPDFVMGMKKAGAIITDTGGMLSHAAIVSRELKKPCIIGTEVATKVIKDGDVVEIHCGRGTVKIVKHS